MNTIKLKVSGQTEAAIELILDKLIHINENITPSNYKTLKEFLQQGRFSNECVGVANADLNIAMMVNFLCEIQNALHGKSTIEGYKNLLIIQKSLIMSVDKNDIDDYWSLDIIEPSHFEGLIEYPMQSDRIYFVFTIAKNDDNELIINFNRYLGHISG